MIDDRLVTLVSVIRPMSYCRAPPRRASRTAEDLLLVGGMMMSFFEIVTRPSWR